MWSDYNPLQEQGKWQQHIKMEHGNWNIQQSSNTAMTEKGDRGSIATTAIELSSLQNLWRTNVETKGESKHKHRLCG